MRSGCFKLTLRVTLSEQVQLEQIAKTYGLNVVEFIRRRALYKTAAKIHNVRITKRFCFY